MINNRFAALLAEKRMKEKRYISVAEIALETGITAKTLSAWSTNKVTLFDAKVLEALCRYFKVKPGDLLELIDDDPNPPSEAT